MLFAPFATRHMHEFGTTREMLASVAVKNHYNGARDPYAHFQNEITVDDVMKSPPVCHPLHLLDCCPQTDGAAAVLLVPAERARRVHRPAGVRRRLRRRHRPPVPAREGLASPRSRRRASRRSARTRWRASARARSTAPRCTTASRSPRSSTSKTSASSRRARAGRASLEGETVADRPHPGEHVGRPARQGPPDRRDRRRPDHRVLVAAARRGRTSARSRRATASRCSTTPAAAARACRVVNILTNRNDAS